MSDDRDPVETTRGLVRDLSQRVENLDDRLRGTLEKHMSADTAALDLIHAEIRSIKHDQRNLEAAIRMRMETLERERAWHDERHIQNMRQFNDLKESMEEQKKAIGGLKEVADRGRGGLWVLFAIGTLIVSLSAILGNLSSFLHSTFIK